MKEIDMLRKKWLTLMKRWLNFTFEVIQIMMLSVRVLHQSRMKY